MFPFVEMPSPHLRQQALDFNLGTYTRAGEASYPTGATSFAWAAEDDLRYGYFAPGAGHFFEGSHTQLLDDPRDLTAWSTAGTNPPTVTSNVGTAPDGTADADRLTFGTSNNSRVQGAMSAVTDNAAVTVAAWVWTESGTKDFRLAVLKKSSAWDASGDFTATTTPQRFSWTVADVLTGATAVKMGIWNETAGGAASVMVGGCDGWEGHYSPRSHVRTGNGVVGLNSLEYASGANVPTLFYGGRRYAFVFVPTTASADFQTGERQFLFDTAAANDRIELIESSGTVYLRTRDTAGNGTDHAITFTAGLPMLGVIDLASGLTTVSGATTGDGTEDAGVALSWTAGSTLAVGATTAGSAPFFGLISQPWWS